MAELKEYSKANQIKGLLAVIGAAVLCALILSLSMLYYYNPSGSYQASNVLLSPENAVSLSFQDEKQGPKQRTVYDHFDFSYFDERVKIKRVINIEIERYARFYDMVKNETSSSSVDAHVVREFDGPMHATLGLIVKSSEEGKHSLLIVEFAPGSDYFRVQLRQQRARDQWAYFYHPRIYQEVETIFVL